MNNLLELCKIFHCKINDLVNDYITDMESLNEDVRLQVTTLKKEQQSKMKGISKFISLVAKIVRIICLVCLPVIIISMLFFPYLINKIDIKDNEISIKGNDNISLVEEQDKIVLKINGITLFDESKELINNHIINVLNNNSKTLIIGYIEVAFLTLLITVYLISLILKHLNNLFKNLYLGETPFTLENVNHIKKMAWLMIVAIILPTIGGMIFNNLLTAETNIDFELFDIVEILFLFSLSYVFEYGRLIEIENKAK